MTTHPSPTAAALAEVEVGYQEKYLRWWHRKKDRLIRCLANSELQLADYQQWGTMHEGGLHVARSFVDPWNATNVFFELCVNELFYVFVICLF